MTKTRNICYFIVLAISLAAVVYYTIQVAGLSLSTALTVMVFGTAMFRGREYFASIKNPRAPLPLSLRLHFLVAIVASLYIYYFEGLR